MIYPYKTGSASAKALANALGVKRIKHERSNFRGRHNKTVINWGSSRISVEVAKCNVINNPEAVSRAANKLLAFEAMGEAGVSLPRFTSDLTEAQGWNTTVVVRHKLNGHSGEGIEIVEKGVELPEAPLYVEYVKKKEEYRLHVGCIGGPELIDVQRKARKLEVPDDEVNWKVRNHKNGFIYAREGVDAPNEAFNEAAKAVLALGLEFGAVDMIYNNKQDRWYVLEVNTACGLEGTTLESYVNYFKEKVF